MEHKINHTNMFLFFLIFSSFFSACNISIGDINLPQIKANYVVNISEYEYNRDSLFLVYTVKELEKIKYANFNQSSNNIFIDSILYSPNKSKLFAFIVIQYPNKGYINKNKFPNIDSLYDGRCLIGFKDSINTLWNIYEFDQYRPSGWTSYKEVHNLLRKYYFFDEFKNDAQYIWDTTKQDFVLQKFGYNLNEKDFWTKSVVWQKGARIPNLYNFQTRGNVNISDEDVKIDFPKINYPNSILRMFK